jgi:DNA-binding FrmR family transcriptional regulator
LRHKEYSLLLVENPKVGGNNMPTTNNEDECRRICDRLSEIDGQVVTIEQQVRGRVEISGVFRRFRDWGKALEYLLQA